MDISLLLLILNCLDRIIKFDILCSKLSTKKDSTYSLSLLIRSMKDLIGMIGPIGRGNLSNCLINSTITNIK